MMRSRDRRDRRDKMFGFKDKGRRRFCRFCADKDLKIDYKDGKALGYYVNERGKILPRRITSTCARHQRELNTAIKRARILAFLPYSASQARW